MEAHYWLARALDLQGKTEEAAPHYAEAAKQDIRFESVAMDLGRIYQRSTDPRHRAEGARLLKLYSEIEANGRDFSLANETLRNHPSSPDAHVKMAQWYARLGQYAPAIVEIRMALQLRPNHPDLRHMLARALRSSGRITEATEYEL